MQHNGFMDIIEIESLSFDEYFLILLLLKKVIALEQYLLARPI